MKDLFKVSKSVIADVHIGKIPSDALVLCQTRTRHSRTWEIKRASAVKKDDPSVVAKGEALVALFKAAANNLQTTPFPKISSIQSFRLFSKRIPGMETAKHRRAVQRKITKVASRLRETLSIIGKGSRKLISSAKPWKMIDTDYVLHEVVQKVSGMPIIIARKLSTIWKIGTTSETFNHWLKSNCKVWKRSGSSKELADWIMEKDFDERERNAWKKAHPKEVFSEERFEEWKITQYPPDRLLQEPLWLLKETWNEFCIERKQQRQMPISFSKWLQGATEERREFYTQIIDTSNGILSGDMDDDESFKMIDGSTFEFRDKAASHLDLRIYIAKRQWESTDPEDTSVEAFKEFLERREYEHLVRDYPYDPSRYHNLFSRSFNQWQMLSNSKEVSAWEIANTGLSFQNWKWEQVKDPVVAVPFIRLDADQRMSYLSDCIDGKLFRRDKPVSTIFETTSCSGSGWAIFVIGPDDDLYTASHIPWVFHHSSFLADGAVMSAGEIRASCDGTILFLTSKSGHYKPTSKENIAMLRWFESRGVDLSSIQFSYFQPDGTEISGVNAQDYLDSFF